MLNIIWSKEIILRHEEHNVCETERSWLKDAWFNRRKKIVKSYYGAKIPTLTPKIHLHYDKVTEQLRQQQREIQQTEATHNHDDGRPLTCTQNEPKWMKTLTNTQNHANNLPWTQKLLYLAYLLLKITIQLGPQTSIDVTTTKRKRCVGIINNKDYEYCSRCIPRLKQWPCLFFSFWTLLFCPWIDL